MKTPMLLAATCCFVFAFCLPALPQTIKTRVLVKTDSLIVHGADDFPRDLSCDITVGQGPYPTFATTGKKGAIESAAIHVDVNSMVSASRKDSKEESWFLSLFCSRADRPFVLFDLNMDGEWDVKMIPSGAAKGNFIWLNGGWVEVEEIEGLKSASPKTSKDGRHYVFDATWKLAPTGGKSSGDK
jgi:hypothetical protein